MKKLVLILGLCLWSFAAVAEKNTITAYITDLEGYASFMKEYQKIEDVIDIERENIGKSVIGDIGVKSTSIRDVVCERTSKDITFLLLKHAMLT